MSAKVDTEGDRQKKLDKQRMIMEEKKKQRQRQSGMVVASGARARPRPGPMASKHLRPISRPSVGSTGSDTVISPRHDSTDGVSTAIPLLTPPSSAALPSTSTSQHVAVNKDSVRC